MPWPSARWRLTSLKAGSFLSWLLMEGSLNALISLNPRANSATADVTLMSWIGGQSKGTHILQSFFFFHISGSWYLGVTCRAAVKLDSKSVHSCHTQGTPCSPAVSHSFTRCLSCRIWPMLHERKLVHPLATPFNQWPLKSRCRKITNSKYLLLNPHLLQCLTVRISFQSHY